MDVWRSKDDTLLDAAAMLLWIWPGEEKFLVLTIRSATMKHHRGKIAFPGDVRENTDRDCTMMAVHELHEKLGISPEPDDIEGGEDRGPSRSSGLIITPLVALFRDQPVPFVPNEAEIRCLPKVSFPRTWESHLAHNIPAFVGMTIIS